MNRAIVLVSGGLDSCVSATWAKRQFGAENCLPLNFAYGQRHARELVASQNIIDVLGFRTPVTVNLQQAFTMIGGSSLTSGLREGNPSAEHVSRTPSDLPPTFVPGRNIIMLSIAAALGYTEQAAFIVGGWNAVDYSGYPDCRPEFMEDMAQALSAGLDTAHAGVFLSSEFNLKGVPGSGTYICAPIIRLSKADIIRLGIELDAPMQFSWSCYAGGSDPCGTCDSCKIRIAGFAEVGISDPARLA